MSLVEDLIKEGWLKTPAIISAFKAIKREDFLPADVKNMAEINEALPIGLGQTISQPLVVAFMLEQLRPKPKDKVLDIGSGSGWTTALLSHIVGEKGKVIAVELVLELKEFGEKNVERYNFIKKGIAEFICADGSKGYDKEAPYGRILASASAGKIPEPWKEQLKIGGRIVASVRNSILVLERKSENEFSEKEFPGFVFVPLIEK